ncbi:MAG: hypothetical protein ACHQ7N_07595 [Candidatus Methylomirabilales bacterium]
MMTQAQTGSLEALRLEERQAAFLRVGESWEHRLAWALGFVQLDPKSMSQADWYNARCELAAAFSQEASTYEEVREIQQQFKRAISELLQTRRVRLGNFEFELTVEIERSTPKSRPRARLHEIIIGDPKRQAVYFLAHLLGEFGHLIKTCPAPAVRAEQRCGRWFLAGRPNQLYCSPRCQSRTNTRAARGKATTIRRRPRGERRR